MTGGARALVEVTTPIAGAAVMGTGIVSIAFLHVGERAASHATMWLAAALWLALLVVAGLRAVTDRRRFLAEAATPAALTVVAGVAVLGTCGIERRWDAVALGALAAGALSWLVLVVPVTRALPRRVTGGALLLVVAPEAVAILAAALAVVHRSSALLIAGLALGALGLGAYAWLILRFPPMQVIRGEGDHWIAGGGLAICVVAADTLARAIAATGTAGALREPLEALAVVLLVLAAAWLPVLVAGEVLRPRLSFGLLRWATVFPLGMYGAAAYAVGTTHGSAALVEAGRIADWITIALWAAMVAGTVARVRALLVRA